MHFVKRYFQSFFMIAGAIYLSGCMVGPNFHAPAAPNVNGYTEKPLPAKTASTPSSGKGGKAQVYVYGEDIPAQWWQLLHSPEINTLVERGLANNPSLAAAQASLRQAEETLNAQIGQTLYPSFDLAAGGQRQQFAGSTFGGEVPSSIFSLYNTSVNVSYVLDIFGGARRQIENLLAQVDYQQYQLLASYLTLTANIVTTAITIASLEAQIAATKDLIREEQKQLNILKGQFQLGGVANTGVLAQQTLVSQSVATLPPLEKSLSQSLHALSTLVGAFPNAPLPRITLDKLNLPTKLPVSIPSRLVRQRPDVQAAEALMHAASAQVGVATASLFPQFTITGSYGWMSPIPGTLFQALNKVWSINGQVLQPIFHGGSLRATRRAYIAAYEVSAAQYKLTLLQAFQNVADTLRALETDARTLRAQRQAELAAKETLRLTQEQYDLGGVSYINLLIAQEQYQQTRINRIQAQATRYADTVALFQSLGGGWWNRKDIICGKDPINPRQASIFCPQ